MEQHALKEIVEAVVREMGIASSINLEQARVLSEQVRQRAAQDCSRQGRKTWR